MIRKKLSAKRNKSLRKNRNVLRNRPFGQFEQLEDKRCLAFVGFFDGVTLTLEQTFDDGDVVVDNNGIGNAWRVTDNSGTLEFVTAENVIVELLDNTANQLDFQANFLHDGSVFVDAGNGPRDILLSGANFPIFQPNVFTGDFTITAGDSVQNVFWAPTIGNPPTIQGDFTIDLGQGFDTVFNSENFGTVGGNFTNIGVNDFIFTDFLFPVPLDAFLTVGGDFTMDTSIESVESFFVDDGTFHGDDPDDEERTTIGGNFNYIGGDDIDHVNLNNIMIGGDLNVDLGDGIPFFGDPQNITSTFEAPRNNPQDGNGGPYFELDGDANIIAGDASLTNVITLDGYFDGNTVNIQTGDDVDIINYNWIGAQADVLGTLGAGNDLFILNQQLNLLELDFGNDPGDLFVNNIGKFNFDALISNYHFFNHRFTVGDDTLELTQLIDTGDVTIDNNGGITGTAWRVLTPLSDIAGETTPANNLVLNMLDNTGNDVFIDLDNPVLAFLTLNLGDGDRNVEFIGDSNNPLRDIIINADQGDQHIELSVNAPLAVATLQISLGEGFDSVDDDANNLMLSEDLIFQGVNLFENEGLLEVDRNVFIDTSFETQETIFANNSSFTVGGLLAYLGGNGRDELRLNGEIENSIAGNLIVDLGNNDNPDGDQLLLLNNANVSVGGTLDVVSTNSISTDFLLTDDGAEFGDDIDIELGDGDNVATILGEFGGNDIIYRGDLGVDDVTYGITGNPGNLVAFLGENDDIFTLQAGTTVAPGTFVVDFGTGNDIFNNFFGPFDFDAELFGLAGFNHVYDFADDTLVSTQVEDLGPITIDDNGTQNAIRFSTGGAFSEITPVTNFQIQLLENSNTELNIDFDSVFSGDFAVDLGSGDRDVNFLGDSNQFDGLFSLVGSDGDQNVNIAVNNNFTATDEVVIDLGEGNDTLEENGNDIAVGGSLLLGGVNQFDFSGAVDIAADLVANASGDIVDSLFANNGTLNVNGEFSFFGSQGSDQVLLNGQTTVTGDTTINVGDNSAGVNQDITLSDGTTLGGGLDVDSTGTLGVDNFTSTTGTNVVGDISVNLRGGDNNATILGEITSGTSVDYIGGDGVDTVLFGISGNPVDANIRVSSNDDSVTLASQSSLNSLRIDFGGGDDTFVNQAGNFQFDANLLNLLGFNSFFNFDASNLNILQVEDRGEITLDNNGLNDAIRLGSGTETVELAPADDVRLALLDNTNPNVTIDFDNDHEGFFILQLRNGDRDVAFTGSSNTFGGLVRIEASNGVQDIELARNEDLTVGGTLIVNGRNGSDTIDDGNNNITIGGALLLRGINTFINDNTLNVDGDFNIITLLENENTSLVNNGLLRVGGNISYLGGGGVDNVQLIGFGAIVDGFTFIDLASSSDPTTPQRIQTMNGFSTSQLFLTSGVSAAGNVVIVDAATSVAGDVFVTFSATTVANSVTLLGSYGGTYGTYRGGSAADELTFGAEGSLMEFVALLNGGDDFFTLEASTDLSELLVDFAAGNDQLEDNLGEPHPFPVVFLNL